MNRKFPESYYTRVIESILTQKEELKNAVSPETILTDTLKLLSTCLHLNRGRIFLWDESKKSLVIKYSHGLTKAEVSNGKYDVCEGITGEVFDTGKMSLVHNIMAAQNYLGKVTPRSLLEQTTVSYIAVPLKHEGYLYGVVAVETIPHYDGDLEANALVLNLVAEMFADIIHHYSICDLDFECA